jgi:hypothetical protein
VEDGPSQYSAPFASTFSSATSGCSGPPGNQVRSGSDHSAFCRAASRTTSALPNTET